MWKRILRSVVGQRLRTQFRGDIVYFGCFVILKRYSRTDIQVLQGCSQASEKRRHLFEVIILEETSKLEVFHRLEVGEDTDDCLDIRSRVKTLYLQESDSGK
jgi:hypothetical protein